MLLYSDILSNDEMFSDAFNPCVSIVQIRPSVLIHNGEIRKLIDDIVYEVDCAIVTIKPGADVDIGNVNSQPGHQDRPPIPNRCQPLR